MEFEILKGVLTPLVGTVLGSACVFFMRGSFGGALSRALSGFAAGVMVAASVWSLLLPAIDASAPLGALSFMPAAIGFFVGIVGLFAIDRALPRICADSLGKRSSTMLVLAVAVHNFPEGMAVGAVYAALLAGDTSITLAGAFLLSLGIAIQNFPEGAIISMPLRTSGRSRCFAFACGAISGVVEPIGAALTIAATALALPALPYLLGFAAGAMIYVVIEELAPEMSGGRFKLGTLAFSVGFVLMMTLDVALG